jgi:predicted peroxiredoxin
MKKTLMILGSVVLGIFIGCTQAQKQIVDAAPKAKRKVVFFNVTSAADEDAHAVTMAMQLAGHALDDGREVVLFFNVRGAKVPTSKLAADVAFKDKPIKELLTKLIERGAAVHVCPHCMKALGLEEGDLIDKAAVTTREKLFATLGENTVVFTY